SAAGCATVESIVNAVVACRPDIDAELLEFLGQLTLGQLDGAREAEFVQRLQQTSGPVMAKGVEDTAFYRYHRLTSLNEVGGDPRNFGFSLKAFHAASEDRAKNWPHTMIGTSTHDTKRSEDVRARLGVLSEHASLWRLALR